MQSLLTRRALVAGPSARPRGCSKPVTVRRSVNARRARPQRRSGVECQAFFNFFTPKPAAANPGGVDPRAKPLVEELIAITKNTDAGSKANSQQKEQIAAVVTELSRYCMKNPLKSDLLFGEWKVLFASKPTAVGGPLRSGAGPAVFPGQKAKQIIEAPNKLINSVEYKTLGFLPGYSRQYGEVEPISPDTFILKISSGEIMAGLGGPVKKDFNIQRKIKILYLDEQIRVALFLPTEGLEDSEAEENGGKGEDDIVFVFQRIGSEEEAEDEAVVVDEDDEDEGPAAKKPAFGFPGGGRKLESPATVAERQVRQLSQARGGTAKVAPAAPAKPMAPPRGGTRPLAVAAPKAATQKGRGGKVVEEEEDPREARRRQQEEERARKAAEAKAKADAEAKAKEAAQRVAEAKAAKERAEAERKAQLEKQAAIKELLAKLANEIRERQAEAKEAVAELRGIEKSSGSGLKEIAAARSKLEEAEEDVASVSKELEAASKVKQEADKAAREAKDVVVAAEKALRAKIASVALRK